MPFKVNRETNELEIVYNTLVPYGNVDSWLYQDLIEFRDKNPDLHCKESGVSLKSKNTEIKSFNETI